MRTVQSGRLSKTLACVAYADNSILEYDISNAMMTPFGKKLSDAIRMVSVTSVAHRISWNKDGTVLCIQNDYEFMFINEAEIMNFDWSVLRPSKKPKVKKSPNSKFVTNRVQEEKSTNALDSGILEIEAIKKLVKVIKRDNSFVLDARFTSDQSLVSVELTFDTLLNCLPAPYAIPKFAAS